MCIRDSRVPEVDPLLQRHDLSCVAYQPVDRFPHDIASRSLDDRSRGKSLDRLCVSSVVTKLLSLERQRLPWPLHGRLELDPQRVHFRSLEVLEKAPEAKHGGRLRVEVGDLEECVV